MSDGAPLLNPESLIVAAWRAAVVLALAPWPFALVAAFHEPEPAVVPLFGSVLAALALAFSVPWVPRSAPRGWRLRALLFACALSAGALVALLRTEGPSVARVTLAGVLVGGAVAGVMGVIERAALRSAQRLGARALVALAQALVAFAGLGAVALQVVFTRDAQTGGSPDAGYAGVAAAVAAPEGGAVFAGAAVAAIAAAVAWARLRHAVLWRQVVSALLLTWLPPVAFVLGVVPVNEPGELWRHVIPSVGASALVALAMVLALRGSEVLERHLLQVARVEPRPAPAGSGRRLLVGVVIALLVGLLAHLSLTIAAAARLRGLTDDLRARGEPVAPEELGPPPPEAQDAFRCYVRAIERLGPSGASFDTGAWRDEPQVRGSAAEITSRALDRERRIRVAQEKLEAAGAALDDVAEGTRRPACRVDRASWQVTYGLFDLLDARFSLDLVLGRHDAAADGVQLVHALWDRADPELTLDLWLRARLGAYRATEYLLARGEPSLDACRRLERTFADDLPRDTLRRGVRGLRFSLPAPLSHPVPLVARMQWVRDLDAARTLSTVEVVLGDLEPAPAAPRLGPLAARGRATWFERDRECGAAASWFVTTFELADGQRQLMRLALRLRMHRLEHGAYPATLDALGDVPREVHGRPIVHRRLASGFELDLGPGSKLVLRITR